MTAIATTGRAAIPAPANPPALKDGADAVSGLLTSLTQYLQTDAGQEMMGRLGDAVSSLVDSLTKVTPEEVVGNFVSVVETLIGGLDWIAKNWKEVETGVKAIAYAFAGFKASEGILSVIKLIQGISGLFGGGATAATAAAGSTAATAGTTGVMGA